MVWVFLGTLEQSIMGYCLAFQYSVTSFIVSSGDPKLKEGADREERDVEGAKISTLDAFLDLIRLVILW